MSNEQGRTYQNTSKQWSWEVSRHGEVVVTGSGYLTEEDAQDDMNQWFCDFVQPGNEPDMT